MKAHGRVLCLIGIASSLLNSGASASATVGATTPFVSYEAEAGIRVRAQPVATSPPRFEVAPAGDYLQLSWPHDHSGWTLLVQTNSPGMGLGTNWFALPGSELTDQMLIPVAPSEGSFFFHLMFAPQ